VPTPGRCTLDLGCGEGRLSRDLKRLGHTVIGIDLSAPMLAAAKEADPRFTTYRAHAAALPFRDGSVDCVIAFMSLQDVDDLEGAIRESARVLEIGGRLCMAIVHPIISAGTFEGDSADSPFVVQGSYLDSSYYSDHVIRDGLEITFASAHRPLQVYAAALAEAGLVIERLREPALPEHAVVNPVSRRWQRLPIFLHLRACKTRYG
jgi:SAM-dependent methyltransferase